MGLVMRLRFLRGGRLSLWKKYFVCAKKLFIFARLRVRSPVLSWSRCLMFGRLLLVLLCPVCYS
jgi:hypothetical protein